MSTMPGIAAPLIRRSTTSATVSNAQAIRIATPIHAQTRQNPSRSDSIRVSTPAALEAIRGCGNDVEVPRRSELLDLRDLPLHRDVDVARVRHAALLEVLHRLVEHLREPLFPLSALLVGERDELVVALHSGRAAGSVPLVPPALRLRNQRLAG